jgi:hypothetical protein
MGFFFNIVFLESLDSALHDREVSKLEIESLKEQNEQLLQQYEREKGFHKKYQQVNIHYQIFENFFFVYSVIFKLKIISKKSNVRMMKNYKV